MKLLVKRTGFGDTRRMEYENGKCIGLALQLANGSWIAANIDGLRLNQTQFTSPAKVKNWFRDFGPDN